MALRHFADPCHPLLETMYSDAEARHCSICLLKLAGHSGYGCFFCDIHLHALCANRFKETISFFAHPSHALKLRRSPGRICAICTGDCPQERFVYSCIKCGFYVHSLCAMLPERAGNPFRPGHDLCMVSSESPGLCSACHSPLPKWRYICSSVELHIACAIDPPTAAGGLSSNAHAAAASLLGSYSHGAVGHRSFGYPATTTGQGLSYVAGPVTQGYNYAIQGYGYGPVVQGSFYGGPVVQGGYDPHIYGSHGGSYGQTILHNPERHQMTSIAEFLAKATVSAAVSAFANQLLSDGFNN